MENSFEIHKYLLNPGHPLTVNVVGAGGTGGYVVGDLAALHLYLINTGRPGLMVTVYDPDNVTESNVGRQNFNFSDIGENKAVCLVEKYNRYYSLNWEAKAKYYDFDFANITIVCSDTVKSRCEIATHFKESSKLYNRFYDSNKPYLLIDCGNGYDFGQVIVTRFKSEDKTFIDHFPDLLEPTETHSCSMAESLLKQNLFINKFIANLAINWLYTGIRETQQTNLGYFFNFNGIMPLNYKS